MIQYQFDDDLMTIISYQVINNLFIKNKIDCIFLKIIYTKKMCINYRKYIIWKIRKLKIVLFRCSKSIRTVEKYCFYEFSF